MFLKIIQGKDLVDLSSWSGPKTITLVVLGGYANVIVGKRLEYREIICVEERLRAVVACAVSFYVFITITIIQLKIAQVRDSVDLSLWSWPQVFGRPMVIGDLDGCVNVFVGMKS